jgi:hypothetical protein
LAGLGIEPVFGRPRQSTDNAVVERCHGVLAAWVEPEDCPNQPTLAHRLAYFARLQREIYPACDQQSRIVAYPALLNQARPYDPAADAAEWSADAMFTYLARFRFQRKVEVNGLITLLSRNYSLGRGYQRRTVSVHMDAARREWVVSDEYGHELTRLCPKDLTYASIASLTLTYRQSAIT